CARSLYDYDVMDYW
nr:immunoglobulin heavy chain junction region [Mus musculus]NSM04804.1 immunoglobulin heavy chain junction region [Mus musculus]NSM05771.1 immunoglobulin heavy chain junction region [Mus musculus]NSM06138.1 immunoglobulin heavy chain junction region [Mus musculus]NSM06809.1 immunoglobulin heavy chain junction region [Mus musculus]